MNFIQRGKSVLVISFVLFAAAGIVLAEQMGDRPPPPELSADDVVAMMKNELNLSNTQVRQITPVIEDEISQIKAFISQGIDRDQVKSKLDALREETESKLSKYLTSDQISQWNDRMRQPPPGDEMRRPPQR